MSPEGAESDGSQPVDASLPFSLPFSSSSSISAFVSASSSRPYLLKTFVDLTSPLRSALLREVETAQSGSSSLLDSPLPLPPLAPAHPPPPAPPPRGADR